MDLSASMVNEDGQPVKFLHIVAATWKILGEIKDGESWVMVRHESIFVDVFSFFHLHETRRNHKESMIGSSTGA